jgi:membrane-associated phospholipid phosphatase
VFRRSAPLFAAAFAALAVLVSTGALAGLDQWGVNQLMPDSGSRHEKTGLLESLIPFLHQRWDWGLSTLANVVTLPASPLVSLAILVYCRNAPLVLAWLWADAVEFLCKHVIERPALYDGSVHISPFDSSFPSGHTLRTVLVVAAVIAAWPRSRPWALAWAATSIVLIQLAGWHTPTDIAGGLLLGGLALLCARAAGALGARRLRART